jgi:hypothetical protein
MALRAGSEAQFLAVITTKKLKTFFSITLGDCGRVAAHPEVETDGHGGATMILPGETKVGAAGTQPC